MLSLRRGINTIYIFNARSTRLLGVSSTLVDKRNYIKTWQEIPGPSSLPIIGQLHHFLPGGSLYNVKHALYETLYKKYGPIVKMKILGVPFLIINLYDPSAIEKILREEDILPDRPAFQSLQYYRKNYLKSDNPNSESESTGLITEYGQNWKSLRSKVNSIMLQPKGVKVYSKPLYQVAEDMVSRIQFLLDEKHMVNNVRHEITMWSLESVAVVSLGQRLNLFDPNLPEDSPARKLTKNIHDVFYLAENLDLKPSLWRYISTPLFKKAMKTYAEQWELSKYFVQQSMEKLKKETNRPDDEKSILEKLVNIDERTAVLMAGDSLFAGVDTAANVVTSILYLLARNPDKQKKLREELLSENPKETYLKACIKETLRIIPVVPANLRKVSKDYDVLGYRIPKDSFVILNHEVLGKTEQHFPRPNEFIPERWIVDKTDPLYYGNAHPFVYNPFGFGTRSCIGRRIAQLQLESFTSQMIKNFEVSWDGPPAEVEVAISIYIKGDLPFVFKNVYMN
ncbi:cytochrome P450 CYP12A2 [Pieris rapae]|uniref:cytochrome P450 CYP12A2 n=1 Tax=Pieris rapae TaxID=64459 RepID=UPI001E27A448|nr:cytochrome P450 CYP12A2 [Pieris rapae]